MSTGTHDTIRVVVYRDGEAWIAQCVEYDICAQGADFDTAMRRLVGTVNAECDYTRKKHGVEFSGIGPAPSVFADKFEAAQQSLHADGMELRIAA
jgi:hypothetical protein